MLCRKKLLVFVVVFLILLCGSNVVLGARKAREKVQNKWEKSIKHFEEWDSRNSPPKEAVLFLGSSSIRWWKTAELFKDYPVINRGFGGSQISDINFFYRRIAVAYKPKVIVFYCGYNDLYSAGKTAKAVFGDYRRFTLHVKRTLPETKVIFMSLRTGPAKWQQRHKTEEFNSLVKEYCEKNEKLFYIDVSTGMLNSKGVPAPRDYQDDGVHLTYKADKKWAMLLKPTLKEIYNLE